jgi:hypothetical protein
MPTDIAAALDAIPPLTLRLAAVVVLGGCALMLAVHTLIVAGAAQRAPVTPRARIVAPLVAAGLLALWLGVALVVADAEHFPIVADAAARVNLTFALMGIAMTIVLGLLATSRTFRAINAATPAHWLVLPQIYRLGGALFLFPFHWYGALPGGFAWPAGVGDVAVAALAPFVARALVRGTPRARTWAVLWNAVGILDLIVAPVAALANDAQVVAIYPLALVPLFLGPPLGILLHVLSLRNLWVGRAASHRADAGVLATAGARR